jgi:hypothetical protein
MKKLLVILLSVAALLFGEIQGAAQSPYALQYKGGKFFKGNGLVDPAQYRSLFVNDEYDDVLIGQLERKVGVGLLIGGGSSMLLGGTMFIPAVFYAERNPGVSDAFMITGAFLLVDGFCLMCAGTPLYCIGDTKLKRAARSYNQRKGYASLTVTPCGLALNF